MKKSLKNVIMIGMAAVLIGTSAVTYSYAQISKQPMQPQMNFAQFDGEQGNGGFPNQRPDFDKQDDNSQQDGQNQPPQQDSQQSGQSQAPQQDSQQNNSEPPQGAPQQGEQPQSNQSNSETENKSDADNSNASLQSTSQETQNASVQNGDTNKGDFKGFPNGMKKTSKITSIVCYAFMGVQIAIIIAILAYLILSKFNKLSFNQVFPDKQTQ